MGYSKPLTNQKIIIKAQPKRPNSMLVSWKLIAQWAQCVRGGPTPSTPSCICPRHCPLNGTFPRCNCPLPKVHLPLPKQVTTVVINLLNSPVVKENSCYPKGQPLPPCLEFWQQHTRVYLRAAQGESSQPGSLADSPLKKYKKIFQTTLVAKKTGVTALLKQAPISLQKH